MRYRFALLSLVGALSFLGCSVALDFTECTSNDDCTRLDPALVCTNNQCVPGSASDTGGDTSGTDVPGEVSDACTLHSECHANFDQNYACFDGTCTDLRSEDCISVFWPKTGVDNVVFMGSILPLTGPLSSFVGTPMEQSYQLALNDFNKNGVSGGRKIALVSCDSNASVEPALRSARHLVDDIGVPAIVGPLISDAFIDMSNQVTVPAGVFAISPSASAPDVTGIQDNNLSWRILASDVFQGQAIVDRVAELGVTRVGVFYKNDSYGNGLFSVISTQLVDLLGTENVKFVAYDDPTALDPGDQSSVIAGAVGSMYSQISDAELLIILGTGEANPMALAYINTMIAQGSWDPAVTPDPPARFLLSHGGATVLPQFFEQDNPPKLSTLDVFLDFYEAVSANITGPNFLTFNIRFQSVFPGAQIVTSSTLSFDAALVAGIAMCAVPAGEEITGAKIADAIQRLVDKNGVIINYDGGGYFSTGCNALSQGKNIDIVGVSSSLDFNLETGDIRPSNIVGWGAEFDSSSSTYLLSQKRIYTLDPAPAVSGTWGDSP